MAITSKFLGNLGGKVESRVVSMKGKGGSSRKPMAHHLTDVEVPSGQTFLVTILGSWLEAPSPVSPPHFKIGSVKSSAYVARGETEASGGALLRETASVVLETIDNVTDVEFIGVVYIVKL